MNIALTRIRTIALITLFSLTCHAQEGGATLFNRLCKTWSIVKLEDNGTVQRVDDAQKEYRLVFNVDSTMQQGLFPDGLIPGTWRLDTKTMTLWVKDSRMGAEYSMKIIELTNDELILQTVDNDKSLVIYYKPI